MGNMITKYGNYRWCIEYLVKGKIRKFLSDDDKFPEAYKKFWAMVKEQQLWKKSNRPIQIIDAWAIENDFLVPHNISQYSDQELGIMNEPFLQTGQKHHAKGY